MNKPKHPWIIIALLLLIAVIALRVYLPYWVKDYVNKTLDEVPDYSGSIEDIDISLLRGAYKIEGLKMVKTDEKIPVPFLDIDLIDLSVEWSAVLRGSIVGEIELINPQINFAAEKTEMKQTGTEADWTVPLKELMPLRINRFTVKNGTIAYRDLASDPKVNISIDSLHLLATNLSNVKEELTLPSTITASATSIGGGKLNVSGKANLLKQIPDFDMDAQFEGVELKALNDFTEAYAKLDFEKGIFNLYCEIAVSDGRLEGYIKPIITDLKVFDLSEDKENPLKTLWEGVAGTVMQLFKNQPQDQFATQVPLEGDLNNPETDVWPTIGNVFKNAFVQAFNKKTDNSVSFDEITQ